MRLPGILSLALVACALAPPAAAQDAPLTLADALRLAAEHHETGGIAEARVEQAQAALRQAFTALAPDLTFNGTYTRRSREVTRLVDGDEITVQAVDALNGTLNLDQTLFDLRVVPLVRAARHSLAAQVLLSDELRRALAFDVAETFYAVLAAERLEEAARRRAEVARAVVEDAALRLDAGLAARNELTRSELELATAELSRTQLGASVRSGRLGLELLVGAPVGQRPLAPPADIESLAARGPESLVAQAQDEEHGRADLRALDEQVAALRQADKEPMLRVLPTLDGRATYRATNEAGLSGREEDWSVAAFLTWELFDGGTRYADRALREAQQREGELARARLRREIDVAVRDALADYDTAGAALVQAETRRRVAAQNAEEVRERFRHGLASALEQADAAVSAFEAEVELERQRFEVDLAELRLRDAVGEWPAGSPAASMPQGTAPAADADPLPPRPEELP